MVLLLFGACPGTALVVGGDDGGVDASGAHVVSKIEICDENAWSGVEVFLKGLVELNVVFASGCGPGSGEAGFVGGGVS